MSKRILSKIAIFALATGSIWAQGSDHAAPTISKATDGVFEAFKTHPIVAIGDAHGLAQEEDFFAEVIRDPRFAAQVGNVVVEFGGAAGQNIIDRYVNGEKVPYTELRKVWANTVGWLPTVTSLGYINFFAAVRDVNVALPVGRRIRVWLGDPPVDWATIKTRSDLAPFFDRNQYPAALIKKNLLGKNLKTLLIYGEGHLSGPRSLAMLLENDNPGSLFVITPYYGFLTKSCSEQFEGTLATWPPVALATPVRGTRLQAALQTPGCHFVDASDFHFGPSETPEQRAATIARSEDRMSGVGADALLYLGPAAKLTESPISPDLYLDSEFREEIARRFQITMGRPMVYPAVTDNSVSPQYIHPYVELKPPLN